MNQSHRMRIVNLCCLLLVAAGCAFGQMWPQWLGPDRGAAADFDVPQTWPEQLTQKWKVDVGQGCSTPVLVEDKLYVFVRRDAEEAVLCLNPENGETIWEDTYDATEVSGPASRGFSGPRSSPAVAEGKVVTFGVGGMLSCLQADTGQVLWRKNDYPDAWPRFYTSMSPLIADGLCVALVGGSDGGGIVAYDLTTGEQKWKWTDDGPGYSSPVLVTVDDMKLVLAPMETSIVAVNLADGVLAWQTPFAPEGRGLNASTPVVDGQTVYYGGSDRPITAVKLSKGDEGITAETLWSNADNALQYNTPALKDDKLYGLSQATALFCLNAQSGQTAWTHPVEGQQGFGSVVDCGSVLMALTPRAQLLVYDPSDAEYKQLASYKVSENSTYAFPVISGSRVFIKDENSVILWTVE